MIWICLPITSPNHRDQDQAIQHIAAMGYYLVVEPSLDYMYTLNLLKNRRLLQRFYLGINTSSPTASMHKIRKINAGFMFAGNPNITWAVKICPMY